MIAKNRILLGVLAVLGLLAAYWFLLLAPRREEAAALEAKVAETQAAVAQAESTLASYREARAAYKGLSRTVARLGKAVPTDDDVRSLVVQLESVAAQSKVDFNAITVGAGSGGDASAAAATTPGAPVAKTPPGATPVGAAGFSTMTFDLDFRGDYLRLTNLFTRLERFVRVSEERIDVTGRLVRIEGLTLTPDSGDAGKLTASVSASTYLVPAAETLTGTGAATAPATPEASTTTTTTATATSTGVLR